ncbi:MAG: glycosyltransferase family 4 protein [Candidatus Omnitrophota bacterium]
MKVLLIMLGGLGGDYAYLEDLYNNPPSGVSYALCLPEEFAKTSPGILKEKIEKCDLIHLHSWFPPCDNLYSLRFFKNLKTPLLCSFTTTIWDCHKFYWKIMPYLKMAKCFLYSRVLKPKGFIAWSQKAKSRAIKQFKYDPGKIHVLPPFIKPQPDNAKTDSQKIMIGFVGEDFERKGGPLLLEAFKTLAKKYADIHLKIISSHKIENSENIESYGRKTRHELFSSFYPDCDIFVLPTKADFFGMSILEAMSFGIPVITSDVYAMNEIIDDGKDGFLIPPNNLSALLEKMSALIKNKDFREVMGREAKNKILQKFNPEIIGESLKQIYKACLECNGAEKICNLC